ncbi:RecA-superfamily ATPase possibly involved in signal transduction [Caldisphaera lagunensis DSM 15908]|uniref:RecA-superfamily ATPase possibly involved in signal transduction n=1 Tax=Caldisphaera lagunensis (strain DSM 15908 / JCM 11604 / ANMR 0165 / IC-154) TaxID=1056495 RepID=L0AC25_CALLD|nr:ATPase domain-containing protein [Caldisphaera lagunensis]AFZ70984.1 RecA-superfamily ATPase possibly involved in signal transduction [Caldisphaera lagunensis DSM 15908]
MKFSAKYTEAQIILIAGNPGTGKTTLGSKFLYEGLKNDENSIYLNFTETKKDFYRNMLNLGIDFEYYEKQGKFKYIEAITITDINALSDLLQELLNLIDKMNAKRLVIDSISAIMQLGEQNLGKIRELLHNFFYLGPKLKEVTTFLIAELPYGKKSVGYGVEEFIVDGVIILKIKIVKRKIIRLMEIRKMRGNEISIGEVPFVIEYPDVISFRVPPTLNIIPSGINPSKGFIEIKVGNNKLTFASGTQNIFIVNPSVDSLPFLSFIIPQLLVKGNRIVYRSYIHSESTIKDKMTKCLEYYPNNKELINNLLVRNLNPSSKSIIELELNAEKIDNIEKPNIVIVEGLSTYIDIVSDLDTYKEEHYNNLIRRAGNNITGFYFINEFEENMSKIPLISVYDNVFYLTIKDKNILLKSIRNHLKAVPLDPIEIDARSIESCIAG